MPNYSQTDPGYWDGYEESLPGIKAKRWQIGDTSLDDAWAMVLEMEPGFVIARHAHNFDRFEVVVKGTLHVGDRVFEPGDVMTAVAHEFYGPKVCGPEGCTTMEFFARKQGDQYLEFELEDGTKVPFEKGSDSVPEGVADGDWIERTREMVLAEAGSRG
jgi:hypothetical protein